MYLLRHFSVFIFVIAGFFSPPNTLPATNYISNAFFKMSRWDMKKHFKVDCNFHVVPQTDIPISFVDLCSLTGNEVWTQTQTGGRQMIKETEFIKQRNKPKSLQSKESKKVQNN